MLVLLFSTTCTSLIKKEFSCGEYFSQPLFYYGDSLLPYLLELILLEEEDPTELGLPSDLLRLHHHQLTNKRWKKISCWLQSGLITCLPIENIIVPAISSLATTINCKTVFFFLSQNQFCKVQSAVLDMHGECLTRENQTVQIFWVSPESHCLFSPSLLTFPLTAHACKTYM